MASPLKKKIDNDVKVSDALLDEKMRKRMMGAPSRHSESQVFGKKKVENEQIKKKDEKDDSDDSLGE